MTIQKMKNVVQVNTLVSTSHCADVEKPFQDMVGKRNDGGAEEIATIERLSYHFRQIGVVQGASIG